VKKSRSPGECGLLRNLFGSPSCQANKSSALGLTSNAVSATCATAPRRASGHLACKAAKSSKLRDALDPRLIAQSGQTFLSKTLPPHAHSWLVHAQLFGPFCMQRSTANWYKRPISLGVAFIRAGSSASAVFAPR